MTLPSPVVRHPPLTTTPPTSNHAAENTGKERPLPLDRLPLVADGVGACIAAAAVMPLREVAGLAQAHGLRRAWQALTLAVLVGIALLVASIIGKVGRPLDAGDVTAGVLHVLGPTFALSVACLSRSTARDLLRVAALEKAAMTDALTALANRRRFDERLADEVRRARETGAPLSLVLVDVDRFKRVNDEHGHAAGDAVLRAVAALIAARSRAVDTACRTGGEEFGIIVPGLVAGKAAGMADRLRRDVAASETGLQDGGAVRVTASLGVATLAPEESVEAFASRADAALYAAKRQGRDLVRLAA